MLEALEYNIFDESFSITMFLGKLPLVLLIDKEKHGNVYSQSQLDTIKDFSEKVIKNQIYNLFPQIRKTPIFFISAEKKIGLKNRSQYGNYILIRFNNPDEGG